MVVLAIKDGATLDRPLRVAVVGGGPGGASCAHTLAQNGIETFLFERKMDNCKVCGTLWSGLWAVRGCAAERCSPCSPAVEPFRCA